MAEIIEENMLLFLRPKRLALGRPRCDDQRARTHLPATSFHRLNMVDCAVEQYHSVRARGGSIRRVSTTLVRLECRARAAAPSTHPSHTHTYTARERSQKACLNSVSAPHPIRIAAPTVPSPQHRSRRRVPPSRSNRPARLRRHHARVQSSENTVEHSSRVSVSSVCSHIDRRTAASASSPPRRCAVSRLQCAPLSRAPPTVLARSHAR
jgi:hypothetical protein